MEQSGINLNMIMTTCMVSGIVLIMVAALIYLSSLSRKRTSLYREQAERMDFSALPKVDDALKQRIQTLFRPARRARLDNISCQEKEDTQIYLFDIFYSNMSRRSNEVEYRCVLFVCPRLNLPHFLMVNRLQNMGPLADMRNTFISKGARLVGLSEIEMQSCEEFSQRYILLSGDEAGVRSHFSVRLLELLARTQDILARGEGGLLIFNTDSFRRGAETTQETMNEHLRQARQFFDWMVSPQ